jgi:hypothetical protein
VGGHKECGLAVTELAHNSVCHQALVIHAGRQRHIARDMRDRSLVQRPAERQDESINPNSETKGFVVGGGGGQPRNDVKHAETDHMRSRNYHLA